MNQPGTPSRVLVVEDDPEMGELLVRGLSAEGHNVRLSTTGVDAGADDYVTKPFAFAELNGRVRALLRLLAMSLGELVTRARILEEVWGGTENIDKNIVDQIC